MCKEYDSPELIQKIASDSVIDRAYHWLCQRRKNYSHNNDVWDLRFRWQEIKPVLQESLLRGEFTFSPLTEYLMPDTAIELWSAQDSLVLKAMSLVLGEHLRPILSPSCYHLAGRGGAKAAVREVARNLKPGDHIMKSDVRGYYANINHEVLFQMVREYVPDLFVRRLLRQYIKRTVYCGGFYRDVEQGISLGCPLSPMISALYLKSLDDCMAKTGLFHARFMDDWVIIAPTRWKLREAVRVVNKTLCFLRVEKHPNKTFIGRGERGIDFLGYFLKPGLVAASHETMKRFAKRITRLYEQHADHVRMGKYVKYWVKWFSTGVGQILFYDKTLLLRGGKKLILLIVDDFLHMEPFHSFDTWMTW